MDIMTMMLMVLQHQDDIKVDMGIHTMELDLSSLFRSMKEDPRSSPEPPGKPYLILIILTFLFWVFFLFVGLLGHQPYCWWSGACWLQT